MERAISTNRNSCSGATCENSRLSSKLDSRSVMHDTTTARDGASHRSGEAEGAQNAVVFTSSFYVFGCFALEEFQPRVKFVAECIVCCGGGARSGTVFCSSFDCASLGHNFGQHVGLHLYIVFNVTKTHTTFTCMRQTYTHAKRVKQSEVGLTSLSAKDGGWVLTPRERSKKTAPRGHNHTLPSLVKPRLAKLGHQHLQ